MTYHKYKVVNLDKQALINRVCKVKYASGYAPCRYIGEEGYIHVSHSEDDEPLYYMTVLPNSTPTDKFEWWSDGCARHLYHISELECLYDPELDKMAEDLLSWVDGE